MKTLPIEKEIQKLTRQYLANIIFTIVGQSFSNWVDRKINERNAKIKEEGKMMINMDPEIAKIFTQSTSVSLQKGVSSNLMKVGSKRRRTKLEIEEQKLSEEQEKANILEKLDMIEKMQ